MSAFVGAGENSQFFTVGTCDGGNNVDVESTGGTALAGYATVGDAFNAINAGTHTGTIIVEICASTNEGVNPATLHSSGAGPASYTSINMYPIADGLTVSGNPVTGFGIIQLNGADNVTINGDNPNTAGTNRNLTISNTTTTTVIANSAIRIATSAAVTSADNNTIRNLNLLGNVTSGNAVAITSTTGSSNSSFGIYVGGNGGATATTAPTAITSVTAQTAPTGTTVNGLLIDNNTINQCARAIVFNGAVATVSTGVTVTNNVLGDQGAATPATPPYTAPATTVYTKGIWVAGTTSAVVTGNTIKNIISYVGTTITAVEMVSTVTNSTITNNTITNIANNGTVSITKAILVSSSTNSYNVGGNNITNVTSIASVSGTDAIEAAAAPTTSGVIEKNKVQTVYGRSAGTFGAYGINVTAGTGMVIQNNFVSDINMNMTGGGAFSTQFSVHGIRIAGGTNHKIYHNSVNIFGALLGTATTSILTSALNITATTITGVDVRNNIFANTMTGGTTSIAHVSITLPSGGTSAMNLTLNNNGYFSGPDAARQGIAQVGTTAGTGFFLASNFAAGAITPASNLRSYTSTLSAAGTNDNASLASTVAAPFTSTTDLHIPAATVTLLESGGAAVGLLTDIDGETRPNGTAPDIGADEFSGVAPPANDIAANSFVVPTNGGVFVTGATPSPQASFTNAGTATQTGINVQFTINGPGGYTYTNAQVIASLASGATTTVTFAAVPTLATPGAYTMSASVTTADANPGNNTINGGFTVAAPLGGTLTVGGGGTFPSLTNPGGVFESLNALGATSNVTIDITGDLTGETGAVPLNEVAGGFTVLIKPSGAPRTIATNAGTSFIKLAGADGVTIDGSLSGGTDRSLTVNLSGAGAFVWVATNATSGANNNTVKNVIFSGPGAFSGQGVIGSSGTTFGGPSEFPNSNITIRNNAFSRVQNAVFTSGNTVTPDQNWIIADNTVGSATVADKLSFRGFFLGFSQNFQITNNFISGINSSTGTSSTMSGVQLNGTVSGTVSRNVIKDIKQNNTTGWGSNGVFLTGGTATNVTVANNFISDVASQGFNGQAATDNGYGISVDTGGGYNIWNNTIVMNTNQGAGAATGHTAPILITATVTATGGVDLRNNILVSTQTLGTRYGVIDMATTGSAVFSSINYNNYFAQNVGRIGATTHATLAAWQTATGQDVNSVSIDPVFVTATDFHLQRTSPMLAAGQTIAGVTNDVDNDPRPAAGNPDMGADELVQVAGGNFPTGTFYNAWLTNTDVITGNIDITGTIDVTGGANVNMGGFTLGLGCNAVFNPQIPSVNYIVGNVRRDFCSTGAYLFPVGTTPNGSALTGDGEGTGELTPEGFLGEYSPMTATINAGTTFPSSLTVNVVDTWLPNLGQTSSISRYWNVTETGTVNANMLFQYLPEDVYGNEPQYKPFKFDGVATTQQPGSIDDVNNQFTATGVTSFSGWAAGVRVINAADASIAGRVTTAGGAGIRNATVRLSGGDLTEPRVVQTGAFGSYNFPGLHVGQTYVLEVSAKRFRFGDSTRIISLQDDLLNVDFTANPNEF